MRSLLTTTLIGSLLTISSLAQAELDANVGYGTTVAKSFDIQ